jgi:hypothetical protein
MATGKGFAFAAELKDIKDFLKLLGTTLSGGFTLVGTLLPLTGFAWQSIAPPWPEASPVIPVLGSMVAILTLFLTFRVYTEPMIRRWSAILWISGVVLAIFYLFMASIYLDKVDGRVHMTGFALTNEARAAVNDPMGPKDTPKDLLDYFGHDSEDRIWAGRGVLRWLLLVLCCSASAACAGGFSLLVVATIVHQKAIAPSTTAAS